VSVTSTITTSPSATTSSSRPTTTLTAGSAQSSWDYRAATNCYKGTGAEPIASADPLPGTHTVASCKAACEGMDACQLIVMRSGLLNGGESPCWLRRNVVLDKCNQNYPDYDSWEINRLASM
jgi:hypothetical protein